MNDYSNGNDSSRGGMTVLGFLVGAIVGAGLGVLFAPQRGEDTRRRLGETARKLRESASHRMDRGRDMVGGLKQDARAAIDAGRESMHARMDAPRREEHTMGGSS